jgi:PAS domain S-box-containing protein
MDNAAHGSIGQAEGAESLGSILDSAELGLVLVDASAGTVLDLNKTAGSMFGRSLDALRGSDFVDLLGTGGDGPEVEALLEGGGTVQLERHLVRVDGTAVWLRLACMPVHGQSGRQRLIRVIVADDTPRRVVEEALWESEERLRLAFEVGRMGCWERDLDSDEIVWLGRGPQELFRLEDGELSHNYGDLVLRVHPEDRALLIDAATARLAGETTEVEFRVVLPSGELRWICSRGKVIGDELRARRRMVGIWSDVTERKLAEEELRRTSEQLASVVTASPVAIIAIDREARVTMWNPAAERIFGWSGREVLGRRIPTVPPEETEGFAELHARALAGDSMPHVETERVRKDGKRVMVSLSLAPWRDAENDVAGVMGVLVDIDDRVTARRELERSFELLRQADEERRQLLSQLVRAQEEERKRVAADIHDDTVQAMTAVGLRLALLRKEVEDGAPGVRMETVDGLERSVGDAISRLRRLLVELRPPELDRGGLGSVLRMQLEQGRSEHGFDYSLENQLVREPSGEIRAIAYRIAQEALANARKHSEASRVDVRLENVGDGIFVRVHDDGRGFDVDNALQARRPGHLGLIAMRERAELAGGWLRIDSDGAGTTVQYWLPGSTNGLVVPVGGPPPPALSSNGAQ